MQPLPRTQKYETVNNVGANTADFDVLNLWSAYIVFGNYQNTTVNKNKILGGATLSWKDRQAYILGSPNGTTGGVDIELYVHSANGATGSADNSAQLSRIISWIMVKDPTDRYYLSSTIRAGGATPTNDDARNLMRFLLGAFDPTNNDNLLNRDKLDTMSDALMQYETIDAEQIVQFHGRPSPRNALATAS